MNKAKRLFAVVLAVGLSGVAAHAQLGVGYADEAHIDFFSGKGKAYGTNAGYFVTSANRRPARVEVVDVVGGGNFSKLKFFQADNSIQITNALAAGLTNILCTGHIGQLVAGDSIVIRDVTNDKYQFAQVHLTNSSGIILTNTLGTLAAVCSTDFALASGDLIYEVNEAGSIDLGTVAITNRVHASGAPIYTFQEGRPGLVLFHQTSGGSTNPAFTTINLISGRYLKP